MNILKRLFRAAPERKNVDLQLLVETLNDIEQQLNAAIAVARQAGYDVVLSGFSGERTIKVTRKQP